MRLPFSLNQKKKTKSVDQFVPLSVDHEPSYYEEPISTAHANAPATPGAVGPPASSSPDSFRRINLTEPSRPAPSSPGANSCQRGFSGSGMASPRYSSYGRPISKVFSQPRSPSADLQMAQLEEELDTIMDEMGLEGEQRMQMKSLPLDNKIQLIHSHKANTIKAQQAHVTPLSEHLKILSRAGTQSLPKSRLERLRVDLSYQSIQQIRTFIEEGGLKLLLMHLSQLNDRKNAQRREDEVMKEYELLRCVLAVAKVNVGAEYMLESSSHLKHVLSSIDSLWLPCSVMSLRIFSYLIQQESLHCADDLLASLFRKDTSADDGTKRKTAFALWMDTVDNAISEYTTTALADAQAEANIVEFISYTLLFTNNLLDALASNANMRIKLYEKLNDHSMLVKFNALRTWCVPVIDSHLNRWSESLRRDYNIARSQRSDDIVLENGNDSTIRDMNLIKNFVAHYEAAKQLDNDRAYPSDNEDDFLSMNVATYSAPSSSSKLGSDPTGNPNMSAPVLPHLGAAQPLQPAGKERPLSTNPFYSANNSPRSNGPTGGVSGLGITAGHPSSNEAGGGVGYPFSLHTRSHSNVAETGSLRNLRPSTSNGTGSPATGPKAGAAHTTGGESGATGTAASSTLTGLKNAHALLKKSYLAVIAHRSKDDSGELYKELLAISELAQTMLDTIESGGTGEQQ
ncbi:hypothetical protein GQ54DRAFT_309661 [Martensiomyces pterosporus]|nr:hypothetical protein GQ54DRAFT_309661 [Martensiomyces pterosporus]